MRLDTIFENAFLRASNVAHPQVTKKHVRTATLRPLMPAPLSDRNHTLDAIAERFRDSAPPIETVLREAIAALT